MRPLRFIDPFVTSLVLILIVGILVPVPAAAITVLTRLSLVSVIILFLVYGMRLPTQEVWAGLRNYRLQGGVLLATFVLFPVLGLIGQPVFRFALGSAFALGLTYLTLLPSTVQSSVSFTSIANGNVAGAVCAATISNILGMLVTPALVMVVMGASAGVTASDILKVLSQLLLPFILGQLLQPLVGQRVRANRWLTKGVDRITILLVVASGVAGATARGLWSEVSITQALALVVACALILAAMLSATWWGGRLLHLERADRIALLMCGSKKSLATGLPMAAIIFPAHIVAAVTVPVIIFHQLQLVVAAILAKQLALYQAHGDASTW